MIGALVVATNKEILEQIDELRKKIPNGELNLFYQKNIYFNLKTQYTDE